MIFEVFFKFAWFRGCFICFEKGFMGNMILVLNKFGEDCIFGFFFRRLKFLLIIKGFEKFCKREVCLIL